MPWTAVNMDDGAYVRFSGVATGAELVRANTHFYQQAYKLGPHFVVFDFSEIERLDVSSTDIARVAAQDLVAAAAVVAHLSVAVVAPDDVSYRMSRLWELEVAETGWRTKVARSRAEAFGWLEQQGIAADRFAALQH